MSDSYHLLKPAVDMVVKPLNLSQGLMQAGKNAVAHKSSNKTLRDAASICLTDRIKESSHKAHKLAKHMSAKEGLKLNLDLSKINDFNTEHAHSATPHFFLRDNCVSELHFTDKHHFPKIQMSYLKTPDFERNTQSSVCKTPQSRSIYSHSPSANSSRNEDLETSKYPIFPCRKTIVLDLDETLIHASPTIPNPDHTISRINPDGSSICIRVNIRPYAKDFLKILSGLADIIIFTAGMKSYADPVLSLLDPNKEFIKARFYRESCISHPTGFVKDLTVLKKDLRDVLLIDNLAISFSNQKENGILISSWYGDKSDNELLLLLKYLRRVLLFEDMRKCDKNFHLQYI